MHNALRRKHLMAGILAAMAATCTQASNLVINGDFETNGGRGQLGGGVSSAASWASGTTGDAAVAFNFIADGTADDATAGTSGGMPTIYSSSSGTNIFLWGPGNGVNNGFTGSPNGGYFLASHAVWATAVISQSISGLTPGKQYTLTFDWAQGQLTDTQGDTSSGWDVNFGSENASTGALALASQGFGNWTAFNHNFTATSASQTLSFLAIGGPSATDAMALLDGISLTEVESVGGGQVPEPASLALMMAGLMVLSPLRRLRKTRS